jgi:hypothetical protein
MAENRSRAPLIFAIDVFNSTPKDRIIIVDPTSEDSFLFRVNINEPTDPGRGIQIDLELNYEAKSNDKGAMLWFVMPRRLREKFFLHELTWNGVSMLKEKGLI